MSAQSRASGSAAPAGGTATAAAAPAPPATFTALFQHSGNDLLNGSIDHGDFVIDPTNSSANTALSDLIALMDRHTSLGNPTAYGQFDETGTVQVFFLPQVVSSLPGQTTTLHEAKLVMFHGELVYELATDVHVDKSTHLALSTAQKCHAFAELVQAANARPPGTTDRFFVDEVDSASAQGSMVRSRLLWPIPFQYVPLFLDPAHPITAEYCVKVVYQAVVADGLEAECTPMLNAIRQACTRKSAVTDKSHMDCVLPTAVSRCPELMSRRRDSLRKFLPGLANSAAPAPSPVVPSDVARELELNRDQDWRIEQARKAEREEKKLRKRANMCGGTAALETLFRLCQVTHFDQLPKLVKELLDADNEKQWDGILQAAFDEKFSNEKNLKVILPAGTAKAILQGKWETNGPLALDGGGIANLFLLYQDQDFVVQLNEMKEMAADGKVDLPPSEIRALCSQKVHLPLPERTKLFIQVSRTVMELVQGPAGDLTTYLSEHLAQFSINENTFKNVELLAGRDDKPLRGVLHLMVLNIAMHQWCQDARRNLTLPVLDPGYIFRKMNGGRPWQPMLNESVRRMYRLDFFAAVVREAAAQGLDNFAGVQTDLLAGAPAAASAAAAPTTLVTDQGDAATIISNLTLGTRHGGLTSRAPRSPAVAAPRAPRPAAPGVVAVPPRAGFSRVPNPQHNITLFGSFNDLTVVTCQALKKRIREGNTPEVVESKVTRNGRSCGPMCLAYHVRGNCSENCGKAYDHVPYTDAEYQASGLIEWCTAHWVAEA